MEFSQVMERRTRSNLVHWCWRASAGLQWGFYNTFTVFFFAGCSVSERTVLSVHLSSLRTIFTALSSNGSE